MYSVIQPEDSLSGEYEYIRTGEFFSHSYVNAYPIRHRVSRDGGIVLVYNPENIFYMSVVGLTAIISILFLIIPMLKKFDSKIWFALFLVLQTHPLLLHLRMMVIAFRHHNAQLGYGIYLIMGIIILTMALSVIGLILNTKQQNE